jgi:hypothetical protein
MSLPSRYKGKTPGPQGTSRGLPHGARRHVAGLPPSLPSCDGDSLASLTVVKPPMARELGAHVAAGMFHERASHNIPTDGCWGKSRASGKKALKNAGLARGRSMLASGWRVQACYSRFVI